MIALFILVLAIGGIDVLDAGSLSAVTTPSHAPAAKGANGDLSTTSSARGTHAGQARAMKPRRPGSSIRDTGNDKIVGKGSEADTVGSTTSDRPAP